MHLARSLSYSRLPPTSAHTHLLNSAAIHKDLGSPPTSHQFLLGLHEISSESVHNFLSNAADESQTKKTTRLVFHYAQLKSPIYESNFDDFYARTLSHAVPERREGLSRATLSRRR